MVKAYHVLFQFLVLIFIKTNVNDATQSGNSLGVLSRLFNKGARSPLVLVIQGSPASQNNFLRTADNLNDDGDDDTFIDENINNTKSMQYINDILRSTGDETDPVVQETKDKFDKALRARCEKVLECEVKCRKKKSNSDKCKKSCKDVYESLCKPQKKKDDCGSDEGFKCGQKFSIPCGGSSGKFGKTLPPCW